MYRGRDTTILVRLVSQAGTGFTFNHKRSRLREKLTLLHYDPIVLALIGLLLPCTVAQAPALIPLCPSVAEGEDEITSFPNLKLPAFLNHFIL
ncbi:hypothetical protein ACRRTK_015365 [Alexandromys fortis]